VGWGNILIFHQKTLPQPFNDLPPQRRRACKDRRYCPPPNPSSSSSPSTLSSNTLATSQSKRTNPLSLFFSWLQFAWGVLEAGNFSENTGTNTISGTQIIFIAKQMGCMAYLY